jgi:hypothetical protein
MQRLDAVARAKEQTVVEVDVVWEPMHQNDRRFRAWVVSDVNPVLVPRHKSLLVAHHSLGRECQRVRIPADPQKPPLRPQSVPDALLGHRR